MNFTSLDDYYEIIHLLYLLFSSKDINHRKSYKMQIMKLIAKL